MGSLVQTYLNDEERKTFDLVKSFLAENDELDKDTPYAMVKYCIKYTCGNILDRFGHQLPEIDPEDEIFKMAGTVKDKEEDTSGTDHDEVIYALEDDEKGTIPDPEPEQEGKKKRVMKYVIGGIDFRPKT